METQKFEFFFQNSLKFEFWFLTKSWNHHSFVNISPTLVIDTSMERSSRALQHGEPKIRFFSRKFEIEFDLCWRAEINIQVGLTYMSTSGMHRRPFEGRHLVLFYFMYIILSFEALGGYCYNFSCSAVLINPLQPEFFFFVVFQDLANIGSFSLPTHSRDAHRNFLMIPSYFKIEILTIQDKFVLLGHKGLNSGYLHRFYCLRRSCNGKLTSGSYIPVANCRRKLLLLASMDRASWSSVVSLTREWLSYLFFSFFPFYFYLFFLVYFFYVSMNGWILLYLFVGLSCWLLCFAISSFIIVWCR